MWGKVLYRIGCAAPFHLERPSGKRARGRSLGIKPPLNRAYSLAKPLSPTGQLTLIFDQVPNGTASNYLNGLKTGDELLLSGPYENFVSPLSLDQDLLFVSR